MTYGAVSLKSHTAENSCTYGHCDVLVLAIEILNYIEKKTLFLLIRGYWRAYMSQA